MFGEETEMKCETKPLQKDDENPPSQQLLEYFQ